jgi:hypothetical protein
MAGDDAKRIIDEEFAALTRELDRLAGQPRKTSKEQETVVAAVEKLQAEWRRKLAEHPDRPEWQKRVQQALAAALGTLARDDKSFGLDGKLTLKLDGETLKKHGAPVVDALLGGLIHSLLGPKPPKQGS